MNTKQETQHPCQHNHPCYFGSFHFTAGEVWDDIQLICTDCGQVLDNNPNITHPLELSTTKEKNHGSTNH